MRIALAAAFVLSLTSNAARTEPGAAARAGSARRSRRRCGRRSPRRTPGYRAGLVPWIKLADVKAKHAGQASWTEALFDDGRLMAHYVAAAPGTRAERALPSRHARVVRRARRRGAGRHRRPGADRRHARIAREHPAADRLHGGHDRHRAEPALRAERGRAPRPTSWPTARRRPRRRRRPAPPGCRPPSTATPGRYDEFNSPHVNIHDEGAKNPKYTGGRFVRDDKSEMLVIYGYEKNMPPLDPADKGHFHPESAEAWLVFTGTDPLRVRGPAAVHRQRRATSSTCRRTPGTPRGSSATRRRAGCRSPSTSATRWCSNRGRRRPGSGRRR